TRSHRAVDHQAQVQRVQQVESMPRRCQVPAADVLVAPVYRLPWSSDAALAAVNLMHKALTISREDHDVVPESEQARLQPQTAEGITEVLDLGSLTCTIKAGEAD